MEWVWRNLCIARMTGFVFASRAGKRNPATASHANNQNVNNEPVLELIIQRLETHPEELGTWRAEQDRLNPYLTKEEKELLKNATRKAALIDAHKRVMSQILAGVKPRGY
jgi:hypothetical protein